MWILILFIQILGFLFLGLFFLDVMSSLFGPSADEILTPEDQVAVSRLIDLALAVSDFREQGRDGATLLRLEDEFCKLKTELLQKHGRRLLAKYLGPMRYILNI